MSSAKDTGNHGENKAASFLVQEGYEIVERNFRTKTGEIDIIAQKDGTLVFVEVKTLPNGSPELLSLVLNKRKQQRIIKTAQSFLATYRKYSNNYIRFDAIIVDMPGLPELYHVENAFVAEFL